MREVLVVLGTRPEAVKLRPVVEHARTHRDWTLTCCATGQHPADMLDAAGGVDERMRPPPPDLDGFAACGFMRAQLGDRLRARPPSLVLAQGDTASVLAAARAAADAGIPFAHLEAGLRTFDARHPFPEECVRVEVATLASLHLAPTWRAFEHLRCEGVSADRIVVTGNTSVDAVRDRMRTLAPREAPPPSLGPELSRRVQPGRRWIVVTHHRAESLPDGLRAVRAAVDELAKAHPELSCIWPVHPNPRIEAVLRERPSAPNVFFTPPLTHGTLLWLLRGAVLAITDSGGIQEEAPEFGLPLLVTRGCTERPEGIERGAAVLVGCDHARIVAAAASVLGHGQGDRVRAPPRDRREAAPNPFGDGAAAQRCVGALRWFLRIPGASRPRAWHPAGHGEPRRGATVRSTDDPPWRLLPSCR